MSENEQTRPGKSSGEVRDVPVSWEALEDAFENNAQDVHSYLHLGTGEVIRIVDGAADPSMHVRVMSDHEYLRVDPVSSREQYRWMERFIATVQEVEFQRKLQRAIDGKGAFRRFKDVLSGFPVDRERWFTFRSERLRACMDSWLEAHGIRSVDRPKWRVPTADEVRVSSPEAAEPEEESETKSSEKRMARGEEERARLHGLVDQLPVRELDHAAAFLEFLRDRKRPSRAWAKSGEGESSEADKPTPSS